MSVDDLVSEKPTRPNRIYLSKAVAVPSPPRWRFITAASAMCGAHASASSAPGGAANEEDRDLATLSMNHEVEDWERIVLHLEATGGFESPCS